MVKVDAANDLAWLKAVGRFAPLPIAASRTVKLGGTVARVGFPIQDLMRKPGNQEKNSFMASWIPYLISACLHYSQISLPVQPGSWQTATVRAGHWWTRAGTRWASWRPKCWRTATVCGGGADGHRVAAGECELCGEEQPALELPGIGAGRGGKTERAEVFADDHSAI